MKKRILLIICAIGINATMGCSSKDNKDMITTDCEETVADEFNIENLNDIKEDNVTELKIETETKSDFVCSSGNKDIDAIAEEIIEFIDDNEEIESMEWMEENCCYRVRIQYINTPEDEYSHKRDYFFYVSDEVVPIIVDYPLSTEASSHRYVYAACDFEAKLEDVNFDGLDDLIICLGHSGAQGTMVNCAYLNCGSTFEYNESFEQIPNYQIDKENQLIRGNYRSNTSDVECSYIYDVDANSFVLFEE